jgi:hypothetical protein
MLQSVREGSCRLSSFPLVIHCSYDGASAAASVVSHSPSCSAIGSVSGRIGRGRSSPCFSRSLCVHGMAARWALAVAVAVMLVMCTGVAVAAMYEVGDKAGWTIMGNPNYDAWVVSKKF